MSKPKVVTEGLSSDRAEAVMAIEPDLLASLDRMHETVMAFQERTKDDPMSDRLLTEADGLKVSDISLLCLTVHATTERQREIEGKVACWWCRLVLPEAEMAGHLRDCEARKSSPLEGA